ncbi:hypothetical protein CC86DRAFT_356221 [Ophiobolus disseminans]|uniref:SET domain-containing protein n=1 Tax=Ophiobolus disseminans TaxID=1469910 RepID=A0A6A6ZR42_9PLEO|nr:hypothetical protein CC86DRAFT_356221 [Ophiobolus disseminans]
MANTQGSRSEDPIDLASYEDDDEDDDENMHFTATQGAPRKKSTAYLLLDDDGKETELPVEAIPSSARRKANNRYSANSVLSNSSYSETFAVRKETFAEEPEYISSGDEAPPVPGKSALQMSNASLPLCEARNNVSAPRRMSPPPPNTRLPERRKSQKTIQTPTDSPIGVPAGFQHGREQATHRHVETNASSASGRANSIKATEKNGPTVLPENGRKSSGSPAFKPLPKARMVKRVVSPGRQRSGTAERPHHAAGSRARKASPLQPLSRGSSDFEAPKDSDENSLPDTNHQAIHPPENAHKLTSELLPRHNTSLAANAATATQSMGAQMSASSVAQSTILPSVEITNTHLEIPKAFARRSQSVLLPEELTAKADEPDAVSAGESPKLPEENPEQVLPVSVHELHVNDSEPSRQNIDFHLKRRLDERYEDHAYFVKNTMWRQRTCYERDIRAQGRNDSSREAYRLPEKYVQSTSPFAHLSAIQIPLEKGQNRHMKEISQEIFTKATPKDTVVRSVWSVPTTKYRSNKIRIPSFKEYVHLKTNILADNESKLLTMPYLGERDDERAQQDLVDKLPSIYEIRHDINALSDLRNEQCRFYIDSIEPFLGDVGVTWESILYWLLAPDALLKLMSRTFSTKDAVDLLDRSAYDSEVFHRDEEERTATLFDRRKRQWQKFFCQLKEPSLGQLKAAALVCAAILASCHFSPWYIARQSTIMQDYTQSKIVAPEPAPSKFTFRSIVCRVCHGHNCMFHGQIRERPESDSDIPDNESQSTEEEPETSEMKKSNRQARQHRDEERADDSSESSSQEAPAHMNENDVDIEKVINYRLAANPDVLDNDTIEEFVVPENALPPPGPFKATWWDRNTNTAKWEKRKPFIPCSHDGSCIEAKCRCFRERITCEKSCRCPTHCNRRFPGCNCTSIPGKRTCSISKCLCIKFKRECDADLCGTCGATEILDPVNRYSEEVLQDRCTNVGIQRGVPKKTLLGQSEVHGFGLYAGQDIEKDDIIGEYTGEILSIEESERRLVIYEYQNNMYLFKLNKKQEVDATFMGNKLRFINNANKNLTNCYPKVFLCNTVFRVALYAGTDIEAGTEFFFHYNYPVETTKNFKQPRTTGKVVAVRQTAKKPQKNKSKRAISRSSSLQSSEPKSTGSARLNNPLVMKGMAKARAAKAAKREAMLAEGGSQTAKTARSTGLKQARKSAASGTTQYRLSNHSGARGRHKTVRGLHIPEETDGDLTGPDDANESVSNLVVQDTDEDEYFIPENTAEGANPYDLPANVEDDEVDLGMSRQTGNMMPRRPIGKPRVRLAKSAPTSAGLIPVKRVKTKMGGARPGADRKRKRPLVLNSDDE